MQYTVMNRRYASDYGPSDVTYMDGVTNHEVIYCLLNFAEYVFYENTTLANYEIVISVLITTYLY